MKGRRVPKHSQALWLSRQRIHPPQPGKSRKIPVRTVKDSSALNGKRGDLCITDQRAKRLSLEHRLAQQAPMVFSRRYHPDIRLAKPTFHFLYRFAHRSCSRQARIGADSQKGRDRLPRQPNQLRARKKLLDTSPRPIVFRRRRRIAIEENIYVQNNHRW